MTICDLRASLDLLAERRTSDGIVRASLGLPSVMRFSVQHGVGRHLTLSQVEAEHARSVLVSVDGNKTKAAQILGIDRRTLREILKRDATRSDR